MEKFQIVEKEKYIMKKLGLSFNLNQKNRLNAKPNAFLDYHQDRLTVNFVDRGLAHYDKVVSAFFFLKAT